MRICYIGDARSVHTVRWVSWFAEKHDVMLISTAPDHASMPTEVVTLSSGRSHGSRLVAWVLEIRRILRTFQPDVLHCHYINEPGWLGAAARRHPLIITAWGSDVYRAPDESSLARRLSPWALRQADWVTCDSVDQAQRIRLWGVRPERVSVIGWGVDRDEFHPGVDSVAFRTRLDIPPGARVVLAPRQWVANSNITTIVEAHAELPPDVYLILKRLPDQEPDGGRTIQDAIGRSPARARVRIVGEISADELPLLYASADVIVSLGTTDGTPVSLLEAMAIGRPVVALANNSVAEWVEEPGGQLVRSLVPLDVARAITAYLSDPRAVQRAAAHNVSLIASRADRDVEFARMDEIYSSLVAGAPTRKEI